MRTKLLTGLLAATAALTGWVAQSAPAAAFNWTQNTTQPQILSKSKTGFDDKPFQPLVQKEGQEWSSTALDLYALDPSKLKMKYAHDVSVYFINEGAEFRSKLGYTAAGGTNQSGLIFGDIASTEATTKRLSEANGPLKRGDGVKLGRFQANTQLDFYLGADAARKKPGQSFNVYSTQETQSIDRLQHVVAYAYDKYIVLGFEDKYGAKGARGGKNQNSDRDFNDVVLVLNIGEKNVRALQVPEPSIALGLLGMAAVSALGLRRRQDGSLEQDVNVE